MPAEQFTRKILTHTHTCVHMGYPVEEFEKASEWIQKYSRSFSEKNDLSYKQCRQEAESILSSVGYYKTPGGTYRKVYESDSTVVKLALGEKGKDENAAEIRNNTRLSGAEIPDIVDGGYCSGSKYIADVFEYETRLNRWIVMEKAKVTPNNVSHETANRVQEAFRSAGIHIEEISPINMGRINNIPVAFDYAGT